MPRIKIISQIRNEGFVALVKALARVMQYGMSTVLIRELVITRLKNIPLLMKI